MKRIAIAFCLLLLLAPPVQAQEYDYCAGAGGAAAGPVYTDCSQIGSHEFVWFGDYTGDTDKGCIGSTATDGTVSSMTFTDSTSEPGTASPTSAGIVMDLATAGHYVRWPITSKDIFDSSKGIFCADIYLSGSTNVNEFYVGYVDANNYLYFTVDASGIPSFVHKGQSKVVAATSTTSISDTTWTNICGRWDSTWAVGGATGQIAISVGGGSYRTACSTGCNVTDADAVTVYAAEPANMAITAKTVTNEFYLDNITIDTASGL